MFLLCVSVNATPMVHVQKEPVEVAEGTAPGRGCGQHECSAAVLNTEVKKEEK